MRPGRSFFEPTWYQMFTATTGADRSCESRTVSPLGSVYRSTGIRGTGISAEPGTGFVPPVAPRGATPHAARESSASAVSHRRRGAVELEAFDM